MTVTVAFKNGQFLKTLGSIKGFGLADNTVPTRNPRMNFYLLYDGYFYTAPNPATDPGLVIPFTVNGKTMTGSGKS